MKRKRQIILSVIASCILIGIAWGFYEYSRPHTSAEDKKTDVVISADSLYAAFMADEPGADKKFINKVLEVKGVIQDISISDRKPFVLLHAGGDGGINCLMATDSATVFSTLKKNTEAVVKGKCSGYLMDVNLVDCVIK
jgi:hypothetical protein